MKSLRLEILLTIGVIALAGCASRQQAPDTGPTSGEAVAGIGAFETVCLKTAPSFASAAEAAKSFGIDQWDDSPIGRMGMNRNQSLGVQIKPGIECVVTTPTQAGSAPAQQFGQAIARATGGRAPGRFPVAIVLNGQPFIFHHDRDGGETFVMLKQGASSKR